MVWPWSPVMSAWAFHWTAHSCQTCFPFVACQQAISSSLSTSNVVSLATEKSPNQTCKMLAPQSPLQYILNAFKFKTIALSLLTDFPFYLTKTFFSSYDSFFFIKSSHRDKFAVSCFIVQAWCLYSFRTTSLLLDIPPNLVLVRIPQQCEVDLRLEETRVTVHFQEAVDALLGMWEGSVRGGFEELYGQFSCLTVQIHLKVVERNV